MATGKDRESGWTIERETAPRPAGEAGEGGGIGASMLAGAACLAFVALFLLGVWLTLTASMDVMNAGTPPEAVEQTAEREPAAG